MKADVEFANAATGGLVAHAQAPYVPRVGEVVQIRRQDWRVLSVNWALDYADDAMQTKLRAIVELVNIDPPDHP